MCKVQYIAVGFNVLFLSLRHLLWQSVCVHLSMIDRYWPDVASQSASERFHTRQQT